MKKLSIVFTAVIVLAASLSAQSLVELAKREKARRETFKGRHAPIVRAADLRKVINPRVVGCGSTSQQR